MRAIVQDRYGDGDVLQLGERPVPEPAAGEVLVRVVAAGVDQAVWHLVSGSPRLARLAFGLRAPKRQVPGMELAGVVEKLGPDVTSLRVGDEVFGSGTSAYAEYAIAKVDRLAIKPRSISFEQAAIVSISGCAALLAVRDAGRLQPGQSVLVIGAAGGVGHFAVQLAVALGGEVTAVCRPEAAEWMRQLGATHVIDYTRDDLGRGPERYDLIIDIAGGRTLREVRRKLTPTGALVIAGSESGGPVLGGLERTLAAAILSPFSRQRLVGLVSGERTTELEALAEHIDAGRVVPVIDGTLPLADAGEAIRRLRRGGRRGKLVLVV